MFLIREQRLSWCTILETFRDVISTAKTQIKTKSPAGKLRRELDYHKRVRRIISYDDTPAIKKIYCELPKKEYKLFQTAYVARVGKEILFFSKNRNDDLR